MKTYRVGVIGIGSRSFAHIDTFMALPSTELIAAADVSEAALARFTDKYGITNVYADYRSMLEAENLDIVSVPTGAHVRCDIVLAVAEFQSVNGILIEKPMAIDLAEADQMIAAAEIAGTKLAVNHQRRCDAKYRRARQLVDDGAIGTLSVIRGLGVAAGIDMTNNGTHLFDAMGIFGEEAEWVWASVTQNGRDITADDVTWADRRATSQQEALVAGDTVSAVFSFKNGARGNFESLHEGNPRAWGVELVGTKGRLVCINSGAGPYPYPLAICTQDSPPGEWKPIEVPESESSQHRMVTDLIGCIEGGAEHPSSGYHGRAALELIMAIYESQKQGRKVALPLASREHPLKTL